MTLRARIAVTAAAAVALAFLIAAGGLYATTARALRGEVDRSLAGIAEELTSGRPRRIARSLAGVRTGALGGPGGFVQIVDSAGGVLGPVAADHVCPTGPRRPPWPPATTSRSTRPSISPTGRCGC